MGSKVGPPWAGLVLAHTRMFSGIGICRNLETRFVSWAVFHVPQGIPEQFFATLQGLVS